MKVALKLAPIWAYLFLHTILITLVASIAVGLTLNKFQAFQFALAATAANLLGLIFTCWAVLGFLWRPDGSLNNVLRARKGLWGLVIFPAIAFVITIVFLLMMTFQDQTAKGDRSLLGPAIHELIIATWVFFVVSFLANIVLLVFCYTQKSPTQGQTNPEAPYTGGQNSLNWSQSSSHSFNSNGITILPYSSYNQSAAESSVFSEAYEFQTLTPDCIRSVSSRTRLVEPGSAPSSGLPTSITTTSFNGISGNLSSKQPFPMETIPGSASNSPEKPLGWPFNERQTDDQRRNSVKVPEPTAVPSVTTPSRARVLKESHIHPIFRSDSPEPHPTPSPTTSVVASPLAGTAVSQKDLARIRSTSNLTSAASIPLSAFGGECAGFTNIPSDEANSAPGRTPVTKSKSFQVSTSKGED